MVEIPERPVPGNRRSSFCDFFSNCDAKIMFFVGINNKYS